MRLLQLQRKAVLQSFLRLHSFRVPLLQVPVTGAALITRMRHRLLRISGPLCKPLKLLGAAISHMQVHPRLPICIPRAGLATTPPHYFHPLHRQTLPQPAMNPTCLHSVLSRLLPTLRHIFPSLTSSLLSSNRESRPTCLPLLRKMNWSTSTPKQNLSPASRLPRIHHCSAGAHTGYVCIYMSSSSSLIIIRFRNGLTGARHAHETSLFPRH